MYFIFVLLLGIWLGYKLKTLVEFLRLLKMKNYMNYYFQQYEDNDFQVINLRKNKLKKKVKYHDPVDNDSEYDDLECN